MFALLATLSCCHLSELDISMVFCSNFFLGALVTIAWYFNLMQYHHVTLRQLTKLYSTWLGWFVALAWTELPVKRLIYKLSTLCLFFNPHGSHFLLLMIWISMAVNGFKAAICRSNAGNNLTILQGLQHLPGLEAEEVSLESGTWKALNNCGMNTSQRLRFQSANSGLLLSKFILVLQGLERGLKDTVYWSNECVWLSPCPESVSRQ